RLLLGLGDAYSEAGDKKAAVRLWSQVALLQPKNLELRLALLSAAYQDGDDKRMEQPLAEIKQIEGEGGAYWPYGEGARLLVGAQNQKKERKATNREEWARARRRAAEAGERRPAWPAAPLLEADILAAGGDADAALDLSLRAIELGERRPAVIRRVVGLL